MRKIVLVLVVLAVLSHSASFAQDQLSYSEVVTVDSTITKQELYKRAKLWFAETFKNPSTVIQLQDEAEGQFVGRWTLYYEPTFFMGSAGLSGNYSSTISIYVKDGRYKYSISDFNPPKKIYQYNFFPLTAKAPDVPDTSAGRWQIKYWTDLSKKIDLTVRIIIASLKEAMSNQTPSQENW